MGSKANKDFNEGEEHAENSLQSWIFQTDLEWALKEAKAVLELLDEFEVDFKSMIERPDVDFINGLRKGYSDFITRHNEKLPPDK